MSEALFWFDWGYDWLKLLVCVGLSTGCELGNGEGLLGATDLGCGGTGLFAGGGFRVGGFGLGAGGFFGTIFFGFTLLGLGVAAA